MAKFFSLAVFLILSNYCCRTRRVDNICSTKHIKRVFLGLGEVGVLTAYNITLGTSSNISLQGGCQMEIITCSSCVISLSFSIINLICCRGSACSAFSYNTCRCDYVWISEPPYDDSSGVSFCRSNGTPDLHGKGFAYKSKTKTVRISLFYRGSHVHAFTMDYKSERNRQFFFGTSQHTLELNLSTGFISSPFFPAAYPRDLVAEYILTCVKHVNSLLLKADFPEDDSSCRVHLVFTDFQLAPSSTVEFYEESRRVGIVSGTFFRPPVVISEKNSLTIRFSAAGRNNVGFKAAFSFITEKAAKTLARSSTDCGGYVDSFGGTITMMKMVHGQMELFDCLWLIKPSENVFSVKSHLYLKVTTFVDFAGYAELQVRQGLTSESPVLERFRYPVSQNFQEHVIPFKYGFYVNLKAFFGPASHFAVSYASFSQNKCFTVPEYLCKNSRCISKALICDGYDHCGDNSDEPAVCHQGGRFKPKSGRWYMQAPNYYFPKVKEFLDLKTASIIILGSLGGLIFFIGVFTIILYQTGAKRNFQDQTQSVSDIRDRLSDEISIEDVVIDDPPCYEPPPNYEEVIKMSMNRSSA